MRGLSHVIHMMVKEKVKKKLKFMEQGQEEKQESDVDFFPAQFLVGMYAPVA